MVYWSIYNTVYTWLLCVVHVHTCLYKYSHVWTWVWRPEADNEYLPLLFIIKEYIKILRLNIRSLGRWLSKSFFYVSMKTRVWIHSLHTKKPGMTMSVCYSNIVANRQEDHWDLLATILQTRLVRDHVSEELGRQQ